ncbi:DEDD exonuclease domain-containing protein [Stackebrandtia albiflava]|uniref:DEDD exonuclease domain-containing protein n=1 Tax=Stackebrandtia albiflava TaxID=406432 RepID=UPI0011BF1B9B|nr:DEDD exonuclease domain-containing protein [Stackebrandtia albiflava]
MSSPTAGRYVQPSFDDLGTPLSEITFMVVDLETTGVAADAAAITEIGAVKVRGGEVLGEFHTLVNPGEPIDARITQLTGITDAMVAEAPPVTAVLPGFLEFAQGTVWVAHNAPFDVGFLRAACDAAGYPWPRPQVVDTVVLARRLVDRSEVPNKRLGTLARFFGAKISPTHRALDDARATVDVLHALLERLGAHYVLTDTDLADFQRAIPAAEQRRKRHLAKGLPRVPGVYVFRDAQDRPLYIGTSVDIAGRVRSYFSGGETRKQMRDMLRLAERIEPIECAHRLEAQVRELRMIATAKPPFNRRSKYPERLAWLRLTDEAYPRLSLVRKPPEAGSTWLGPFTSAKAAAQVMEAVHDALPIRQCKTRLSPRRAGSSCALAELGCPAPCLLRISVSDYSRIAERFSATVAGDPDPVVAPLLHRIGDLSGRERFEEAAVVRGRLAAFLRAAIRTQRTQSLIRIPELVAAGPAAGGGWEIAVVRHGQLAAAAKSPPRINPMPTVESLLRSAATIPPSDGNLAGSRIAETELILTWLEGTGVRLVRTDSGWAQPRRAAGAYRELLDRLDAAMPHQRGGRGHDPTRRHT